MANGECLMVGRAYQKQLRQRLEHGGACRVPPADGTAESSPYFAERSVLNAGAVLCFPVAPRRVAALSYGFAELLCALGLEEKLAVIAPAEDMLVHVLPQYRDALAPIPLLRHCGDGVPTVTELQLLEVDLALCSWYFPEMLALETRDALGFQMYIAESTIPEKAGLEQLYRDILNLGRIFRAEDRAIALVEQLRRRITTLIRRVSRRRPVRVFVYDGGEGEPLTAMKGTLETDLITLAGGENVFGGREGTYSAVSWQQVAEAAPEVIVIHDYLDSMGLQEKQTYLRERPELQQVPAVRQGRFVSLSLLEIFPGVQSANAVETLIRSFHPDAL